MRTRIRAAALVVVAGLLAVAAPSVAAHAQVRPEPRSASSAADCASAAMVRQLTDDGRQARDIAVRQQIHHELVQLLLDRRWGCA